jgi:hypothetical protein
VTCSCGAVLVRVVAFGYTPRAVPTEAPMRLIGLAVMLTIGLTVAPRAAEARPGGPG